MDKAAEGFFLKEFRRLGMVGFAQHNRVHADEHGTQPAS